MHLRLLAGGGQLAQQVAHLLTLPLAAQVSAQLHTVCKLGGMECDGGKGQPSVCEAARRVYVCVPVGCRRTNPPPAF
jgi:hypothetical protein